MAGLRRNLQVKKPDMEVLGWRGYMWSAGEKFSKTTLDAVYGREINIKFSGNSFGGHSCSQHDNSTLPQLETSVALCCVTKLHILVAFCLQHKVHLCHDHAV